MKTKPLNIMKDVWRQYAPRPVIDKNIPDQLALEMSNRLIYFFQPGDFYYYILNISTADFEFMSPGIEKVLGYKPEEVSLEFFFNNMHPDDQKIFVNFENEVGRFLHSLPKEKMFKYKVRMDIRMRRKDNSYTRILYQAMVFDTSEEGNILRSFGAHTDIGYLKIDGRPTLSFIGFDGEPSFIDVKVSEELIPTKELLTEREKEILMLIMNGLQNKEIAVKLGISKLTVDRHRKNMIIKNGCKNSNELITKAIKEGWI